MTSERFRDVEWNKETPAAGTRVDVFWQNQTRQGFSEDQTLALALALALNPGSNLDPDPGPDPGPNTTPTPTPTPTLALTPSPTPETTRPTTASRSPLS